MTLGLESEQPSSSMLRRDDDGLDLGPLDPSDFAPVAEPNGGAGVGFAGVRVAKDGGEEFEKTWARRRAGVADRLRQSHFQRFDSHSANPLQVPHSGFPLGGPCRDPKRTLCLTMRGLRKRATQSGLAGQNGLWAKVGPGSERLGTADAVALKGCFVQGGVSAECGLAKGVQCLGQVQQPSFRSLLENT